MIQCPELLGSVAGNWPSHLLNPGTFYSLPGEMARTLTTLLMKYLAVVILVLGEEPFIWSFVHCVRVLVGNLKCNQTQRVQRATRDSMKDERKISRLSAYKWLVVCLFFHPTSSHPANPKFPLLYHVRAINKVES